MADRTETGQYIRPRNPGGRTGSAFGVTEADLRRLEAERRAYNKLRRKVNADQVYRSLAAAIAGAGGEDTKSIEKKYGKPVYGVSKEEKANIGEQLQDLLKTAAGLEGDKAKTRGDLAKQRGAAYGKMFDIIKQAISSEGSARGTTGSAANRGRIEAHMTGLEAAQDKLNLILQPDNKGLNITMAEWAADQGSNWREIGSTTFVDENGNSVINEDFLNDLMVGQAGQNTPANKLAFIERAVQAGHFQSLEEFERRLEDQIDNTNAPAAATNLMGQIRKNQKEQALAEARWVKETKPLMQNALRSQRTLGANIEGAISKAVDSLDKFGLGSKGVGEEFAEISATLDAKDPETGKSPIETEQDRLLALLASDQYSDPLNQARQQFYRDPAFRKLASGMTGVPDEKLTEKDMHLTFKALNKMQRQNRGKRAETSRANIRDAMRRFKAGEELEGVNPQDAPKPPTEKEERSARMNQGTSSEYSGDQPPGDADVDQNLPTPTSSTEKTDSEKRSLRTTPLEQGSDQFDDWDTGITMTPEQSEIYGNVNPEDRAVLETHRYKTLEGEDSFRLTHPLLEGVKGNPELPAQYIAGREGLEVYQNGQLVDTLTEEDERLDTLGPILLQAQKDQEQTDLYRLDEKGIPADLGEGRFGHGRGGPDEIPLDEDGNPLERLPDADDLPHLNVNLISDHYKKGKKKQLKAAEKLAAAADAEEDAAIAQIAMPEVIQADTPPSAGELKDDPSLAPTSSFNLEEAQKAAQAKINAALASAGVQQVIGAAESGAELDKDDPTTAYGRMVQKARRIHDVEAGTGRK